jgi:hypothetical protein
MEEAGSQSQFSHNIHQRCLQVLSRSPGNSWTLETADMLKVWGLHTAQQCKLSALRRLWWPLLFHVDSCASRVSFNLLACLLSEVTHPRCMRGTRYQAGTCGTWPAILHCEQRAKIHLDDRGRETQCRAPLTAALACATAACFTNCVWVGMAQNIIWTLRYVLDITQLLGTCLTIQDSFSIKPPSWTISRTSEWSDIDLEHVSLELDRPPAGSLSATVYQSLHRCENCTSLCTSTTALFPCSQETFAPSNTGYATA